MSKILCHIFYFYQFKIILSLPPCSTPFTLKLEFPCNIVILQIEKGAFKIISWVIYLSSYYTVKALSYLVSDHFISSAKKYCSNTKGKFSVKCKFIYIVKAINKTKQTATKAQLLTIILKSLFFPIYFSWPHRYLKAFLSNCSIPQIHTFQITCLFLISTSFFFTIYLCSFL